MEVVLSTYPGSFRLPNKAKLSLLRERNAAHLFNSTPVKESNFAPNVVFGKIDETGADFASRYGDVWAHFNSNIVNLQDKCFYGLKFEVKSGSKHRADEDLVEVARDLEDFKIVEATVGFKIRRNRHGEYV
jgi:hypothetical protein